MMSIQPTYNTLRPGRTLDLRKRRAWFDEPPPAPAPPAPATPPTTPPPAEKTLTQTEVNEIVGNRVKEAKTAAVTDLLKELGFEKSDDLKTLVKEAKKRADADKTEIEKANDLATAAAKERDDAIAERDAEKQGRLMDKRNTAIEAAAAKAHAEVPADVILWAVTYHADMLEKVMGEDGAVKSAEVEKLINTCKEERKTWFARGGVGSPSNRDGRVPQPGEKEMEQARTGVRRQVRRSM